MSADQDTKRGYDASSIQKLTLLEAMRKRPGLYIGSTDQRGLHKMIYIVVNDSAEQAIVGTLNYIEVTIYSDNTIKVADNNSAFFADLPEEARSPYLQRLMTERIEERENKSSQYRIAFWESHPVLTALSTRARAVVSAGGALYSQDYQRGVPVGPVVTSAINGNDQGFTVYFQADPEIFETTPYDADVLIARFRDLCYLIPGLTILFTDERKGKEQRVSLCFENGIVAFVQSANSGYPVLHAPFHVHAMVGTTDIDIALQYSENPAPLRSVYVNAWKLEIGGTPTEGFYLGFVQALNIYAHKHGLASDTPILTGADVRQGLTAIISVKVLDPVFRSCTIDDLGNPEVRTQVRDLLATTFQRFLEDNPEDARRIIEHCLANARRREASKDARKAARQARKERRG